MEDERSLSGFSPLRALAQERYVFTAFLSVLILVGAAVWSTVQRVEAAQHDLNVSFPTVKATTNSPTEVAAQSVASVLASTTVSSVSDVTPTVLSALAQSYQTMHDNGQFNANTGALAATQIVDQVHVPVPARTFFASQINTTADTSYARMLQYHSDMKVALSPLMKNTQPEFALIGEYVQTNDPSYLAQLRAAAKNYTDAADNMANVVVPTDAVSLHVAGMNALEQYAAVLNAYADNASDPLTSTMLLRNLEDGENSIISSFNAIAQYYANHPNP